METIISWNHVSGICGFSHQHLDNHFRPNVLALNFASTLIQSLLYLLIFMAIAACLLYYFYRSIQRCARYDLVEGLQQTGSRDKQWGLVIVTFLLTTIYLPLSTLAVHVIVWSEDLWIVPNPYTNTTSSSPDIPPLGPTSEYRDPLDFCWTTTMKKDEVNYAPIFIVISGIVFVVVRATSFSHFQRLMV